MGNTYSSNVDVTLDEVRNNLFAQYLFNYAKTNDKNLILKKPEDINGQEPNVLPFYCNKYYELYSEHIDFYFYNSILSSDNSYNKFLEYFNSLLILKQRGGGGQKKLVEQEELSQSEENYVPPKSKQVAGGITQKKTGNKINKKIKELQNNIVNVKENSRGGFDNESERTAEGFYEQESV